MRYGSVCSGIEAATMAWHPLGWSPAFFSEIEKFPSAVLAHHYGSNMPGKPITGNGVPNLGDMTKFEEWPDYAIDLLVGGTPCQDYSIAGVRLGMDGDRGQLTLTYIAVAARYRPRWLVWENVPGVLSSNEGRDFARFLGDLSGSPVAVPAGGWQNSGIIPGISDAYGLAYRVIDAQYVRVDGYPRAVPQRRRRVFVVGYLGNWRRAAAVLFDAESLLGNPAPRREAGEGATGTLDASLGRRRGSGMNPNQLAAVVGGGPQGGVVSGTVSSKWAKGSGGPAGDEVYNMVAQEIAIAPPLTAGVPYGDNDSRHTMLVADVAPTISSREKGGGGLGSDSDMDGGLVQVAPTLRAGGNATGGERPPGTDVDTADSLIVAPAYASTLTRGAESSGKGGYSGRRQEDDTNIVASIDDREWAVRRLTPRECERLQGFPDDFTLIPWRGKRASDGPRYKGLGNSMAVNAMRWIGRRIDMVDKL